MPASWERERWTGADAELVGAGQDGAAQLEQRAAGLLGDDLGVVPVHVAGGAERLGQRLLGGEAGGQRGRAAARARAG